MVRSNKVAEDRPTRFIAVILERLTKVLKIKKSAKKKENHEVG